MFFFRIVPVSDYLEDVEAVARLLPGVIGNAESLVEESHEDGLLEHPVYTKPAAWRGHTVPEVLRSGDHARIGAWRQAESLRRTASMMGRANVGFALILVALGVLIVRGWAA